MFWRFLLCLGPAILAFVLWEVMLLGLLGTKAEDFLATSAIGVLVLGSLISAGMLGAFLFRKVEHPAGKVFATIFGSIAVVVIYLAVGGFAGCLVTVFHL